MTIVLLRTDRRQRQSGVAYAGQLLALAAVYIVAGRFGLMLAPVSGFASLVWPPAGIALAALIVGGYRLWPGIALGAFATNFWAGAPALVAGGIALGNTVEAVAGTLALRSIPGFRGSLERFTEVVHLAVIAGVGSAISATVGMASLTLGGVVSAADFTRAWGSWWAGDLLGILIVTPLLSTWVLGPPVVARPAALAKVAVLGVVLSACATLLFVQEPQAITEIPILQPYVLFLPLIWAALCYGVHGAATGTAIVAIAAVWGTYSGHGAFVRASPVESLTALSVFLASISLATLVLGSVVSEHKQTERERVTLLERERLARAEAEATSRAKDDFLAVLSHELRTPLHAMLGWTQMLRARRLDERAVQKGLLTIERNIKMQTQLIEDLLDVSRIVAGKLRLACTRVDLSQIIAAVVDLARVTADAKSIRVDVTIEPFAGEVRGDPTRLQQIVSNLLANAVKFTPRQGSIRVRLEREDTMARITVEDTGCGISPELLPRIFDRFYQAESATVRSRGGLGLGLAIVRHLVELHGGTVRADSPGDGRGATFTVTLPVVSSEREAVATERKKTTRSAPLSPLVLEGVRILVVDDDPDAGDLLEVALQNAGADVRARRSARAALEELASFHPHLLISDIGMPEEDGYALLRQVRARESAEGGHILAVALTAFASQADREQALALGFETHVAKPVSPEDIVKTASRLWSGRREATA